MNQEEKDLEPVSRLHPVFVLKCGLALIPTGLGAKEDEKKPNFVSHLFVDSACLVQFYFQGFSSEFGERFAVSSTISIRQDPLLSE